ncbi:MAG: hypothetical protein ACLSDO_09925, partial [Anaerotruncus colihominis]
CRLGGPHLLTGNFTIPLRGHGITCADANGKAVCVRHPAATAAKAADRACRCAAAETGKAGFAAAKRQASPSPL